MYIDYKKIKDIAFQDELQKIAMSPQVKTVIQKITKPIGNIVRDTVSDLEPAVLLAKKDIKDISIHNNFAQKYPKHGIKPKGYKDLVLNAIKNPNIHKVLGDIGWHIIKTFS